MATEAETQELFWFQCTAHCKIAFRERAAHLPYTSTTEFKDSTTPFYSQGAPHRVEYPPALSLVSKKTTFGSLTKRIEN